MTHQEMTRRRFLAQAAGAVVLTRMCTQGEANAQEAKVRAVTALRATQEVLTRERDPRGWAMVQDTFGAALERLFALARPNTRDLRLLSPSYSIWRPHQAASPHTIEVLSSMTAIPCAPAARAFAPSAP